MKLKISSTHNRTEIELTHDTAKKPVKISLSKEQINSLLDPMRTASRADKFSFEIDLPD